MEDIIAGEPVTDQTFAAMVLNSDLPVLVDFWAPWCTSCRAMASAFEELAQEYEGRVKFVQMNVDKGQRTAMSLKVLNLPAIILFAHGKLIERQVGLQPKANLSAMIDHWFLEQAEENQPRIRRFSQMKSGIAGQ